MSPKLHFGSPQEQSFSEIVRLTSKAFLVPNKYGRLGCSIVPFLCFWRQYEERLPWLLKGLRVTEHKNWRLCFEYPVASTAGNKASYTDLMLLSNDVTIAVEAKWREQRGCAVGAWLGKDDRNRVRVRDHWWRMINEHLGREGAHLDSDVENQMLHRTASACAGKPARAIVVYQVFWGNQVNRKWHANALKQMAAASLYSPASSHRTLEFYLMKVQIEFTGAFSCAERTANDCSGGVEEKARIVREAIQEYELLRFGNLTLEQVKP